MGQVMKLNHLLILLAASNLLTGCFTFDAPVPPELPIVTSCSPLPALPVVVNTSCPTGSNLEWCFDKDNTDKLKDRLTILYNAAKTCHQ